MSDINQLRHDIDSIDDQILELLSQRAQKSLEVKKSAMASAPMRRSREAQIVKRMVAANQGPFSNRAIQHIFETIVYNGRGLQTALRVGYLGPQGTYSEQAATEMFGQAVELVAKRSILEASQALDQQVVDVVVLPLENSTEGGVNATHRILQVTSMPIIAEHTLRIQHALLGKAESLAHVNTVYGHPQALGQCREWLETHVPKAKLVQCESNAIGLEKAQADKHGAAIAYAANSVRFGLNVLECPINDEPDNTTRFVALAPDPVPSTGDDKTSLFCTVHDKAGALHELLGVFASHNISMTRLESQPFQGDYGFFIDFAGHQDDADITLALDELRAKAAAIKVLGSYPREVS